MATLDVWRKQLKLYAELSPAPKMASRGTPPSFPISGGAMGVSNNAMGDPNEAIGESNLKVITEKWRD